MFKFYERNRDGSTGAPTGEAIPSDDFYFDFFKCLGESPYGTIMEREFEGRVYSRMAIIQEYHAPVTAECNCREDYHHYCTGCELHEGDCTCYNAKYATD